jgi:hypothetical protein
MTTTTTTTTTTITTTTTTGMSSSTSSLSRAKPLPMSKAVLRYLDQLAAKINDRGGGIQRSDLREAQQKLGKAHDFNSIKVIL